MRSIPTAIESFQQRKMLMLTRSLRPTMPLAVAVAILLYYTHFTTILTSLLYSLYDYTNLTTLLCFAVAEASPGHTSPPGTRMQAPLLHGAPHSGAKFSLGDANGGRFTLQGCPMSLFCHGCLFTCGLDMQTALSLHSFSHFQPSACSACTILACGSKEEVFSGCSLIMFLDEFIFA